MDRKKMAALLLTVCLLLSMGACTASPSHQQAAIDAEQDSSGKTQQTPAQTPDGDSAEDAAAPKKTYAEKIHLTIAGINCSTGDSDQIQSVIYQFNRQSEDYVIGLLDYNYGSNSYEQARMNLNTKMLAGDGPDMLLFSDVWSTRYADNGLPIVPLSPLSYINSGTLLDLDEFVQNDADIDPDEVILWDALHEFGGMYVLAPKFTVDAVYCLPETAEKYKNWTLDDYIEIQNSVRPNQDMFYNMSPQGFLRQIGSRYIHEAMDIETATCDFETPEFIKLLETACSVNTYRTEDKHMQADGTFKTAQEMVTDGELLFSLQIINSAATVSFDSFCAGGPRAYYGEGESPYKDRVVVRKELGYIGYPTPDGKNGTYVDLQMPIGICANTEYAEGCWEFIKFAMQHPIYRNNSDGTPVLRSQLADNLQTIKSSDGKKWSTTKADQDVVVGIAEQCTSMSFYDTDILNIVLEEAAVMLAGDATPEQTAARIQNRASVLVMERYG